ncbi:MAG: hypothetical protein KC451_08190 [Amylibacter sp.]|nr:hypothetical protein [Amylibacter sp.]
MFQAEIRIEDTFVVLILKAIVFSGAQFWFVLLKNQPQHPFINAKIATQNIGCEILVDQFFQIARAGVPLAVNLGEKTGHPLLILLFFVGGIVQRVSPDSKLR